MKKHLLLCAGLLVAGYNLSFAADAGGITSGGPAASYNLSDGKSVDGYLLESNYTMGDKVGQVFIYESMYGVFLPFFMSNDSFTGEKLHPEGIRELYEKNAAYKKHIDGFPHKGEVHGFLKGIRLPEYPPGTPETSDFLSDEHVVGGSVLLAAIVTALVTRY